jgi:hypothetical protein
VEAIEIVEAKKVVEVKEKEEEAVVPSIGIIKVVHLVVLLWAIASLLEATRVLATNIATIMPIIVAPKHGQTMRVVAIG